MARFFLAEFQRDDLEFRGRISFCGEERRPGHFALFNKNALNTLQVQVIEQAQDRYGWFVECDSVPDYFERVLIPVMN